MNICIMPKLNTQAQSFLGLRIYSREIMTKFIKSKKRYANDLGPICFLLLSQRIKTLQLMSGQFPIRHDLTLLSIIVQHVATSLIEGLYQIASQLDSDGEVSELLSSELLESASALFALRCFLYERLKPLRLVCIIKRNQSFCQVGMDSFISKGGLLNRQIQI